MKLTKFSLIFLIFCCSIYGQVKKPVKPNPTPTPTKVQQPIETIASPKVIVEKMNGDRISGLFISGDKSSVTIEISDVPVKINLSEIRSLRFAEDLIQADKEVKKEVRETIIEIESALVFKNGEAVPVARNSFALLDESAVDLMRQAGVRGDGGKTDDQSIYFGFLIGGLRGTREVQNAAQIIKQHIKYQFETDFNGKATIKNITPGKYFLFGYSEIRKANVIWDLPIEIKETDQFKIVLDQKNAAIAF